MPKSPWDPKMEAAIRNARRKVKDDFAAGRTNQFGDFKNPVAFTQEPTAFQEKAATKAKRLVMQAGPNMNLDERYRNNMLGRNNSPASAASFFSFPMQHLDRAFAIANRASQRQFDIDQIKKGF